MTQANGLSFERMLSIGYEESNIFKSCEWETRDAVITNEKGEKVFEQRGVEFPKQWSQAATNITCNKYFRGQLGTPERESSVAQLISRVVDTITNWGVSGGYFIDEDSRHTFSDELTWVLLHQLGCFNSPVLMNLGWPGRVQQASACYILDVQDDMESILDLYKTEGMIFRGGSGAGLNVSTLRSSKEPLSAGGHSSGPVSFLKGLDASAGSIRSGGATRRAALLRCINVDHPNLLEFIDAKVLAEKQAHALIDAGFSGAFNDPSGAYASVSFQNSNNSVRVSDKFMRAVENDEPWDLIGVTDGVVYETLPARKIMRTIAEAAHFCADPGVMMDDLINNWHTTPNSGRIACANPCTEFNYLNNTSCNLASVNLAKFYDTSAGFDIEKFRHVCRVLISAMEFMVGFAGYPTQKITDETKRYRPLGLGFTSLGQVLMMQGLAYDSHEGRTQAAAITALLTATAYAQSAHIARVLGPFDGFAENREPMLAVIKRHRDGGYKVDTNILPVQLLKAIDSEWIKAINIGSDYGFRNAQISNVAPVGTISFVMDSKTTGIEPCLALIQYKRLVGGGTIKIINDTVPVALQKLGYNTDEINDITSFIENTDTIEGAPHLKTEHLSVFDCSFKPENGKRFLSPMAHLKMVAACQPFLSGSASKTINLQNDATVEDIEQLYMEAWRLGIKNISVYRDGCKRSQPLSTKRDDVFVKQLTAVSPVSPRRRLPDERSSITHRFEVSGHEGYVTVGCYSDGSPGEIFITMAKEGSTLSGLIDCFATSISINLQYGVPLKTLVDKFSHYRFEPSGFTKSKDIPIAKSIVDYIFRWLALKFLSKEDATAVGIAQYPQLDEDEAGSKSDHVYVIEHYDDSPTCNICGSLTQRSGSCYTCPTCGSSSGCA